jgi:hypothetical protein
LHSATGFACSPEPHSRCIGYRYARYSLERSGKPFIFSVRFSLFLGSLWFEEP